MEKGVIVLDIETDWGDVSCIETRKDLEFKCGIIYDYSDNEYHIYRDPKKLVEHVENSMVVVTYNGELFDFVVLEKYGLKTKQRKEGYKLFKKKSIDLFQPIKNGLSKWNSLDELMYLNFGVRKEKYDPNNLDQLIEHCKMDVKYTKELYELNSWKVPIPLEKYDHPEYYENYRKKRLRRNALEKNMYCLWGYYGF
jgi:hypothetical protein